MSAETIFAIKRILSTTLKVYFFIAPEIANERESSRRSNLEKSTMLAFELFLDPLEKNSILMNSKLSLRGF
jgi:hypothetical protein